MLSLIVMLGNIANADTTTYFQQYDLTTTTFKSYIKGTYNSLYSADTKLYLGEDNTNNYRPTIDTTYGLKFVGQQLAIVYGSSDTTQYSNEIRNTKATITMWVYILDAQTKQMLFCKQNSMSHQSVQDKLCIGMEDGYFIGQVYNETLTFDGPVYEGWNFIAVIVQLDTATSSYTRLRMISYARSQMTASYKTFSFKFTDDVDYDLVFGGHYDEDGATLIDGFAGYMLEIRLYSSVILTIAQIDDQIDWDCTLHTTKYCEFCPAYVYTANQCLEDTYTTSYQSLEASYQFGSNVKGINRYYYQNQMNSLTYKMYFGTAQPSLRMKDNEPHRSEINGLYFEGDDFITMQYAAKSGLIFDKYFTIEMWVRFTETTVSQNYYLFQKVNSLGKPTPNFQFYFQTDNSFVIEMNDTQFLVIENAYNGTSFSQNWVYIGVSFATLLYDTTNDEYKSKMCAFIYGPDDTQISGCAVAYQPYTESWYYPFYWETRIGNGYKGFIYTLYLWDWAKAQTSLYYTPLRNYPVKDQCDPFTDQQAPACPACDQALGSSQCYSSCPTNSYADQFEYCYEQNCTNTLCTVCYTDTSLFSSSGSICSACIDNAFLDNPSLGNCQCYDGFYENQQVDVSYSTCEVCHGYCTLCYGQENSNCYECANDRPNWGYRTCIESCEQLGDLYVYDSSANTCVLCYDNYYTIDWLECIPLPYPLKLTNYNNQYLIMEFSQPVSYNTMPIEDLVTISISGPDAPYNISWAMPYWSKNSFQQFVFISISVNYSMTGTEQLYMYLNNIYFTDVQGYQLLVRNSSSKTEYIPQSVTLVKKTYIDPGEAAAVASAGNGVLISMLITIGFNAVINLLSSGSIETMWTFINVMQVTAYIPLLQLTFPYNIVTMFSYLSVVNSNIIIFQSWFATCFNLNVNTFYNDTYVTENFNTQGWNSMKFIMNAQSMLAIVCVIIFMFPVIVISKKAFKSCFACGKFWENTENNSKWNAVIRFYLESFLEINMAAFINMLALNFSSPLEKFNSVVSLILTTFSILFPLASCFFLFLNKVHFESEYMMSKYGALYEMFKEEHWYHYMGHFYFFARRLAYICILIFLPSHPFIQLLCFQGLNFMAIMLFILTKPYKENIVNSFAIMNEAFLFVEGCYLFVFLDESLSSSTQTFYGWIVIGIVILQVIVNLGIIIPYKIVATYYSMGEKARLRKLRFTNQVERKYLVFDYKKFFLKGLQFENVPFGDMPDDLSSSDTSSEIRTPPAKEIPQYEPSLKSSDSEPQTDEDTDKIPPQAHSFTDKPTDLNIKPHTPEKNPIDLLSQDDKRNDNYDSQSKESEYMDVGTDNNDDIIDPTSHTLEQNPYMLPPLKKRSYSNVPGFQWMDDIQSKKPSQLQSKGGSPKSSEQKYFNNEPGFDILFRAMSPREQAKPYNKDLLEDYENNKNGSYKPKKSVKFEDSNRTNEEQKQGQKKSTQRKPNSKGFYASVIDAGKDIDDDVFKSQASIDSNALGKNLLNWN